MKQPPFVDDDPMGIYQKILSSTVYFTRSYGGPDADDKKQAKHWRKNSRLSEISRKFEKVSN